VFSAHVITSCRVGIHYSTFDCKNRISVICF
jgi:hypothetical protein